MDSGSPIFCLTEWWVSLKSMISDILGFSMEAHGDPMAGLSRPGSLGSDVGAEALRDDAE